MEKCEKRTSFVSSQIKKNAGFAVFFVFSAAETSCRSLSSVRLFLSLKKQDKDLKMQFPKELFKKAKDMVLKGLKKRLPKKKASPNRAKTAKKEISKKQREHLVRARFVRDSHYKDGAAFKGRTTWRGSGRKSKRAEVEKFMADNPFCGAKEFCEKTGISKATFYKYRKETVEKIRLRNGNESKETGSGLGR